MYLLLVISQQPYHLGTSNHFHLHPLMQCHALQLAITASLHHGKPYKGSLWWLCTIIATTLGTTLDVPSFGHISTTIPPRDLKPLSSASSDAVPCITVSDNGFIAPWEAIQRLTLVVVYYHCNHLR